MFIKCFDVIVVCHIYLYMLLKIKKGVKTNLDLLFINQVITSCIKFANHN